MDLFKHKSQKYKKKCREIVSFRKKQCAKRKKTAIISGFCPRQTHTDCNQLISREEWCFEVCMSDFFCKGSFFKLFFLQKNAQ